jgi:hypothetical protein
VKNVLWGLRVVRQRPAKSLSPRRSQRKAAEIAEQSAVVTPAVLCDLRGCSGRFSSLIPSLWGFLYFTGHPRLAPWAVFVHRYRG